MSVVSEPESSSTVPGTALTGTVFTARQVRILKIAVIVMGVLLVGGFAFVLAAIVYQASHPAQDASVTAAPSVPGQGALSIDLPVPARRRGDRDVARRESPCRASQWTSRAGDRRDRSCKRQGRRPCQAEA